MNKAEAIAEIQDVQCGGGIDRSKFPDKMKGAIPRKLWNDEAWDSQRSTATCLL